MSQPQAVLLRDLLPAELADQLSDANLFCTGLTADSRHVASGNLFLAKQPARPSGQPLTSDERTAVAAKLASFMNQAAQSGAVAVLVENPEGELDHLIDRFRQLNTVPCLSWPKMMHEAGALARRYWQLAETAQVEPIVTAVTGTNGKTTVCRLLAELLSTANQSVALMGTTGNGILPQLTPATHTTPDALTLQAHLHQFAQQGARYICLEASSHGLDQGRLQGTPIQVAVFTNLSRDHLDYHPDEDHYLAAKARLFQWPELKTVVLNRDDPATAHIAAKIAPHVTQWTYSLSDQQADFHVISSEFSLQGVLLHCQTPMGQVALRSPLLGRFNVANLLAAIAGALALGLSLKQIEQGVPQLQGAPGRMQVIPDAERLLVVDYAHSPDAVQQILTSLRPHVSGRLVCLLGCGGDRDKGKRPLMTQAALTSSDAVWLTADNPRSEAVETILKEMQQGLTAAQRTRIMVEPDRRQAIRQALATLQPGDALVVAGKGHEDYQEIAGVRHWFDDRIEVAAARDLAPLPKVTPAH